MSVKIWLTLDYKLYLCTPALASILYGKFVLTSLYILIVDFILIMFVCRFGYFPICDCLLTLLLYVTCTCLFCGIKNWLTWLDDFINTINKKRDSKRDRKKVWFLFCRVCLRTRGVLCCQCRVLQSERVCCGRPVDQRTQHVHVQCACWPVYCGKSRHAHTTRNISRRNALQQHCG